MEIQRIFADFFLLTVNLIIKHRILRRNILNGDAEAFPVRHLPVAVQCISGIHANRKAAYLVMFLLIGRCKEVSQRCLNRGLIVSVPIDSKDQIPGARDRCCEPNMFDCTLTFYICQGTGLTGRYIDVRIDFRRRQKMYGMDASC